MSQPAEPARKRGAKALAAGLLCWGVNVGFMLALGRFAPFLVLLGALGVFFGAVLLVWGDSFRTMPLTQKIPAALIALAATLGPVFLLFRWAEGRVGP